MDKSVPRVIVQQSLVIPKQYNDPWDRFVHPYLTLMSDSFSCTLFVPTLEMNPGRFARESFRRVVSPWVVSPLF